MVKSMRNHDLLQKVRVILTIGLYSMLIGIWLVPMNMTPVASSDHTGEPVVRLSYFYKPPASEEEQQSVISHFDTIILTRKDEWFRDEIYDSTGRNALQYLRFETIHDPCGLATQDHCDCDKEPFSNNVGWESDDVCRIRDEHPDWFLKNTDGNVIYLEDFVFMDIGNPEWQQFYLSRVLQSQEREGWHGVFLDNVRGSLDHIRLLDQTLAKYPTDESYVNATANFLQFLDEAYFQPHDIPLYANLRSMPTNDAHQTWLRYLTYLDGAMDEYWAIDWGPGYLAPADWEYSLETATLTQQEGDEFIAVSHGEANETDRQRFAFASFLLITDGTSSFRYADGNYREVLLYNNYLLDLGQPLGSRYQVGEMWHREFERGYVVVNPTLNLAKIVVH